MKFEFWEDWVPPLKNIFYVFFAIFIVAILYTIVSSIIGYNLVIDWEVVGQRLPVEISLKDLEFGNFIIPFKTDNYVVTQWFQGSDIHVNYFAFYFYFIVAILALVLGLTASTFLGKIAYYGLNILFVATLIFFKFDGLLLFGLSDNTILILIIVSYLSLSYIFYLVRRDFDFIQRLKLFLALTLFWGVMIYFFAEVERPFMMLASNGFLIPFLIGVVFIFSVSHEIIHFIVVSLTKSSTVSRNNLTHFTLFSLIYLANVLLLFLHDTHVITWNFYYLNPYLLLGVSAVLGLWGLQSRVVLFDLEAKLYPLIVFVYLAAGLCAFGTLLYFVGNSNDSILQVVKDAIIYSHLGFGSIFFIYVISNFMGMLRSNMKVYQVIYKARNMPHFIFRFAGLIVVTALFLKEDIKTSVYHTISGMFNSQGDYYKVIGEKINAETYYENGGLYGYMNHKSNYSMAKISESSNEKADAITFYKNATRVRPSEMSYVNLGNLYLGMGDFFNSMFTLNDGMKDFPSGEAILNNKGYLFSKTSMTDSALIYFDASARAGNKGKASLVNYLALISDKGLDFDADSVADHYGGRKIESVETNVLLLRNQNRNYSELDKRVFKDSVLNIYSASLLTNYLINQYKYYDTLFVSEQLEKFNNPANTNYFESGRYSVAVALFRRGFVDDAITMLRELSVSSKRPEVYNGTIGLMLMELGYFQVALDYLDLAVASGDVNAGRFQGICQIELGNYSADSIRAHAGVYFGKDSSQVEGWLRLIQSSPEDVINMEDDDKFIFLHFRSNSLTPEEIVALVNSVEKQPYKTRILLELFSKSYRNDNFLLAEQFIGKIEKISTIDSPLSQQVLNARLDYYAHINQTDKLKELMGKSGWITFDKKWFYQALIEINSGNREEAQNTLQSVSEMNSFNEEAVLLSAKFFEEDDDELKSYNILVNALLQNPYSVKLLKAYVIEARKQGMNSYAARAVQDLGQLIGKEELSGFLERLQAQDEKGK